MKIILKPSIKRQFFHLYLFTMYSINGENTNAPTPEPAIVTELKIGQN